jgi:hypothetical protein
MTLSITMARQHKRRLSAAFVRSLTPVSLYSPLIIFNCCRRRKSVDGRLPQNWTKLIHTALSYPLLLNHVSLIRLSFKPIIAILGAETSVCTMRPRMVRILPGEKRTKATAGTGPPDKWLKSSPFQRRVFRTFLPAPAVAPIG